MTDLEREVGRLEARMETVEQELHAIRADVREIRDALVGARSNVALLAAIVAASSTLGALASRILPRLFQN